MIATDPPRSESQKDAHVQGWLVSVLLHGTVAFAALLLVKQIQLVPQDEPFKWNVAMVSPAQLVQPTTSSPNQAPAPSVPSTTSASSPHVQQSAPAQTLPSPQPLAQQTTSSISERASTPVVTEPPPPQPTTPSQSVAHTAQPAEPIGHETVAPMVVEAASIEKPADSPMVVSAASAAQTAPSSALTKRDYGWLSEAILRRVEELKRYPASARVDRAEGKVVVKAVINEDGDISEVEVFQSSGHPGLDKAAVDTMRQAAPFHLPLPLGQPRMTIKIPMNYRLDK